MEKTKKLPVTWNQLRRQAGISQYNAWHWLHGFNKDNITLKQLYDLRLGLKDGRDILDCLINEVDKDIEKKEGGNG